MANEADFAGDRLRLSAFLRIVQNLPQRPARCRRRAPSITVDDHVPAPASNDAQTVSISATREISPSLDSGSEEDTHVPIRGEVLPETENERDDDAPNSPPKQTAPIVYTPKAPQTDPRQHRPSSTTRKRRLPVNELALVRTTTADGLPDRSVGDPTFVCILPLDLILCFAGTQEKFTVNYRD
jgi:hypothetical protein